ncbi:MAG TPA: ATP-dependent protease ATPase subunit HslU [Candidatus Cloacimonadota bacterium]|nr:ATP-dependent protease ATPase subunit HslU [Candidatus Cloacimonadota bacterium]HPT72477.1 ATP-dependent protease ATPase subunit HslU [Candidatus Cloacimonadota bacterium]
MLQHNELTPARIVAELDKYIIGQDKAKRSVAIALRNRWRRQQITGQMQQEIIPNNIILIGPTGVGKTEIARRLSRLANAPFIKVEASKFTEVGYVGRDVESMVRDLMDIAISQVKVSMLLEVQDIAYQYAFEKILDILVPLPKKHANGTEQKETEKERHQRTRDKMSRMLAAGKLDDRNVEIKIEDSFEMPHVEIFSNVGMDFMDFNIGDMMSNLIPFKGSNKEKTKNMSVPEALGYLTELEANNLVNKEKVVETAKNLVENNGIIFIDEIDKITSPDKTNNIDVSRSGVQRDLLPIVEGSSVPTKYGMIDTSHILFIAAGAFHISKPSDLIPELQGRFPIREEMSSLSKEDFEKILVEPENALTKQYKAIFEAEGVKLSFEKKAISLIAEFAALANEKMEDIGARRLHTIMNNLLDEYLFDMPDKKFSTVSVTPKMVKEKLNKIIQNEDLSRYIL